MENIISNTIIQTTPIFLIFIETIDIILGIKIGGKSLTNLCGLLQAIGLKERLNTLIGLVLGLTIMLAALRGFFIDGDRTEKMQPLKKALKIVFIYIIVTYGLNKLLGPIDLSCLIPI